MEEFMTSDLVLVAALQVSGIGHTGTRKVRRPDARHDLVQYVYERTEELEDRITAYSLGDVLVEPKAFFEAWRRSRQHIDRQLGRRRV